MKNLLNPNLGVRGRSGWGWSWVILPPAMHWFSLNNAETVKAVIMTFCSNQEHFIRYICGKFGIPYLSTSPDIDKNSDRGISDIRISDEYPVKEN